MFEYYAVTDLGTLPGGASSNAYGINDVGQVVGSSEVAGGAGHAFRWTPTTLLQDLGTLPGGSGSQASGINVCGLIAGQSDLAGTAARLMRLSGAVWVECKILVPWPATTSAKQGQSMPVVS